MINIDTVYQRVLVLANKEQRGYITPQEFNLYANQAQMEIFEQYFHDLNQQSRIPGNEYVYADADDMLEEKIQVFEHVDGPVAIGAYLLGGSPQVKQLPGYMYRVSRIEFNNNTCELLKTSDFNDVRSGGPLTRPSNTMPVANIRNNLMRVVGSNAALVIPTGIFYFKKPATVGWGYFVVGHKALYDSTSPATMHFELHQAEETELVYKILKYSGLSMKRDDVAKGGQGLESLQVSQEK